MGLIREIFAAPAKVSLAGFLYVNLAIGLLTAIANGSALLLTLNERQTYFMEKIPEMVVWLSVGGFLAICSGYAFFRRNALQVVLRLQAVVLLGLISAIAFWGLSLIFGELPRESRVAWTPGLLSLVAFYSLVLFHRVFVKTQSGAYRYLLAWVLLPCFVLVDFATFIRVGIGF